MILNLWFKNSFFFFFLYNTLFVLINLFMQKINAFFFALLNLLVAYFLSLTFFYFSVTDLVLLLSDKAKKKKIEKFLFTCFFFFFHWTFNRLNKWKKIKINFPLESILLLMSSIKVWKIKLTFSRLLFSWNTIKIIVFLFFFLHLCSVPFCWYIFFFQAFSRLSFTLMQLSNSVDFIDKQTIITFSLRATSQRSTLSHCYNLSSL